MAQKHFLESEETWKGHTRKFTSGLRSTKNVEVEEATTSQALETKKQSDIFVKIYDLNHDFKETIFTYQTEKFPTRSSQGHQLSWY